MTTTQKVLLVTVLVAALGVWTYQARQLHRLRSRLAHLEEQSNQDRPAGHQAALASLQAKVDGLEVQNSDLARALAQANAEKARLQAQGDQARRSAALFSQLVEQADSKESNPTNQYPSQRHVWAAFGRLGRLGALSKEDDSKLSPEERTALEAARTRALEDLPNLVKAAKQYDQAKSDQTDLNWDDLTDEVACLLYGALNLDQQQFNQLYGVMQTLGAEAQREGLLKSTPAPEAAAATKRLMQEFKAQTESMLTPDQTRIFAEVITHFQVEPGKFGYNFSF